MPELPDVVVYIEALERRILEQPLSGVRLASPFLLRTAEPPIGALTGKHVRRLRRLGKRIAIGFEDDLWLVMHLMINGRLHWQACRSAPTPRRRWEPGKGAKLAGRYALAAFDFPSGTLTLTEFGPRKRASLHLVRCEDALREHDPGGLEVFEIDLEAFRGALTRENHTLKRALTDPHLLSGIGNAYSDEILHRARLSPLTMSEKLSAEETARLYEATRATLANWIERLRAQYGDAFPEKVTAFRPEMAVHGKYKEPCPVCGTAVQRIRYADNETNYCPRCQTGGQLLADRAFSRLLNKDWPKTVEDLERIGQARVAAGDVPAR
jgi:formamidopyrimidine-DNA glycosylase